MKDIPDKSINMILCDLPYGSLKCKWDIVISFKELWTQYERIIKDNSAIVLFGSEPFSSTLRTSNLKLYRYDWKWIKNTGTGIAQAKYQPLKYQEDICIFYKNRPTYNPEMILRTKGSQERCKYEVINGGNGEHIKLDRKHTKYNSIYKYPSNVIYFNSEPNSKGKLHSTQKPLMLDEYLIKTYTNEGDIILDNCIGSGTTAVACKNTNRNYIGIEKDKNYYDIACKRVLQTLNNKVM